MQEEIIGPGSIKKIENILDKFNPKTVFLFTAGNSFRKCGAKAIINKIKSEYNFVNCSFSGSNPSEEEIGRALEKYLQQSVDLVIAIGGGSVMDIAKTVNIIAANRGSREYLRQYLTGKEKLIFKGKPLIAVPTTSGTGSEATHFSVAYVDNKKYSVVHKFMLPDCAIIDSELSLSLPRKIKAATGLDAFCQAIESLWSILSTEESKEYALQAITLVKDNFERAVLDDNYGAMEAMSLAAHLSGKAINISKTTAAHAMSYPLTVHFGIPHGHAVAMVFPSIFIFNSMVSDKDVADSRGLIYVCSVMNKILEMFNLENFKDFNLYFINLVKDVGLTTRLNEMGIEISSEDITKIIFEISAERAGNNPRFFTRDDAYTIIKNII